MLPAHVVFMKITSGNQGTSCAHLLNANLKPYGRQGKAFWGFVSRSFIFYSFFLFCFIF